jgi:hypothetical protein
MVCISNSKRNGLNIECAVGGASMVFVAGDVAVVRINPIISDERHFDMHRAMMGET